jgi:hypothetical protein
MRLSSDFLIILRNPKSKKGYRVMPSSGGMIAMPMLWDLFRKMPDMTYAEAKKTANKAAKQYRGKVRDYASPKAQAAFKSLAAKI